MVRSGPPIRHAIVAHTGQTCDRSVDRLSACSSGNWLTAVSFSAVNCLRAKLALLCLAAAYLMIASSNLSGGQLLAQESQPADAAADALSAEDATFFEAEVRPLLIEHCLKCHGSEKQEGGLRLDSREHLIDGGDSGPAVSLDEHAASLLLNAIRYEDYEMPPSGQLSAKKIEAFEEWLARGAPWPAGADAGGMELRTQAGITDSDKDYWAFRPLNVSSPAALSPEQLASIELGEQAELTAVDHFLLDKLTAQQLTFAPPADRPTLLRRLYLDLVGVPPTPAEMASFLNDARPDAYERLVDQLLQDPRYGQKWARLWLDLVRYAESDGFNQDALRPNAYLYRDWLIDALNADMPYDQFVLAQLAGDEIDPKDPHMLAATGYLRHWIYEYNQRDARTQWSNILNDLTDVTGEVFFGLGIGCARCHDHKFDPLLQADYYRLQASFAAFLPQDNSLFGTPEQLDAHQRQLAIWQAATAEAREQLQQLEEPLRKSTAETAYNKFPLDIRPILFKSQAQRDGFEQQIAALADRQVQLEWEKLDFAKHLDAEHKERWEHWQAELKQHEHLRPAALPNIQAAGEVAATPPAIHLPTNQPEGSEVVPATFEVFGARSLTGPLTASGSTTSGRRTALAQWINSTDNPLTHRVVVNRLWQELFGQGLVRNSNDFGRLGEAPSHPELLDWVADWFIRDGKSMKRLQRLLVTSAAYRQSATADESMSERATVLDWQNRLLWHYPARRLDAEQIRDAMLVASESLQAQAHGPAESHDSPVRSIFTQVKRNKPHPFLVAFDVGDRSTSIGQRNRTTTVIQALVLSNSPWSLTMADNMAARLLEQSSLPEQHVRDAYARALSRTPTAAELDRAVAYLEQTTASSLAEVPAAEAPATEAPAAEAALESIAETSVETTAVPWHLTEAYRVALADLCHVLFNSSEFLYID